MRNLFATILAIGASISAVPAIANPMGEIPISSRRANLSAIAAQQKEDLQNSGANQFAQRSLNIAKQIPTEAIGLLMLDVDARSWQVLGESQTLNPISVLDQLFAFLGAFPQVSIVKDVQPWLGKEVAIAFWGSAENKGELTFVALSSVNNAPKFEIFLEKLKSLNLPKPTETLYQNVKILEWQLEEETIGDQKPAISQNLDAKNSRQSLLRTKQNTPANGDDQEEDSSPEESDEPRFPDFSINRFAIAYLPSGTAVVATDRQAIQKMIDLSVPRSEDVKLLSLAENPLFLRSLNNPLWNRSLLAGYGDFKGLGQISKLLAADLPETSEIPGFSRAEYLQGLQYDLTQYTSFDLFTWVTPKGLRSQSNSYFSEVRSPLPKDKEPRDRLLSYLPSNIYGAISSRNLSRQWQWLAEQSKVQPIYRIFVDGLRMVAPLILSSGLDLDIEKDVISLIDGEYAVVALPSEKSPFKDVGVDLTLGMLIRTSKPELANATLAKFTKFLIKFSEDTLQVKKRQVGATLLTSFEFADPQELGKTQSIFAYGWRDPQTLLLTLGSDTAAAFMPTPKPTLAESAMFRDAIADMPQPNFGYFYLNANAIAKQLANFYIFANSSPDTMNGNDESPKQPTGIPEPIQKAINKLGGAVFVYSENSDRLQADFFLGLNR
ncbi:MAG: DUF3352 domain-containing protein [Pseudanabaena sp. CAN_BIN31]|nr:DUF3352 domain-containing protein [Pseudanabaena sp. CAN_BIN31]